MGGRPLTLCSPCTDLQNVTEPVCPDRGALTLYSQGFFLRHRKMPLFKNSPFLDNLCEVSKQVKKAYVIGPLQVIELRDEVAS